MVIGFDIDDTITAHPPFFGVVMAALRSAGHRVVVITMRFDRARAIADLAALGIPYDELHCFDPDTPGHDYWGWKGSVCARLDVEVFFDDSPDILARMPAGTLSFLSVRPDRHHLERLREVDDDDAEWLAGG